MAKFKYLGADCIMGRFGPLKKGDVVDLKQFEVDYTSKHSPGDWKRVDKPNKEGVGIIVPEDTPYYPLTKIRWQYGLERRLKSLSSKSKVLKVCKAMRSLGADIPSDDIELKLMSFSRLVEVVYAEARRLCWDQPGYEPKQAPSNNVVLEEEEPEKEASNNEDSAAVVDEPVEEKTQPARPQAKKAARVITRNVKP